MSRMMALVPLAALLGCIVEVRGRAYVPPPPAVAVDAQYYGGWEDHEANSVVYREYYGCTEEEIRVFPNYRRYYALVDDDFFFLLFMCRTVHVAFPFLFQTYYFGCNHDYNALVVHYNVSPAVFFVNVGVGVNCPGVYGRCYGVYRSGNWSGVTFTASEYRSLVSLKVGVEYCGHPPEVFMHNVVTVGSPCKAVVQAKASFGNGGKCVTGAAVTVKAERPWQMSAQARAEWRKDVETHRVATETKFKEEHKEQVHKVEVKERAEGRRPEGGHEADRKPATSHEPSGLKKSGGGVTPTPKLNEGRPAGRDDLPRTGTDRRHEDEQARPKGPDHQQNRPPDHKPDSKPADPKKGEKEKEKK